MTLTLRKIPAIFKKVKVKNTEKDKKKNHKSHKSIAQWCESMKPAFTVEFVVFAVHQETNLEEGFVFLNHKDFYYNIVLPNYFFLNHIYFHPFHLF